MTGLAKSCSSETLLPLPKISAFLNRGSFSTSCNAKLEVTSTKSGVFTETPNVLYVDRETCFLASMTSIQVRS